MTREECFRIVYVTSQISHNAFLFLLVFPLLCLSLVELRVEISLAEIANSYVSQVGLPKSKCICFSLEITDEGSCGLAVSRYCKKSCVSSISLLAHVYRSKILRPSHRPWSMVNLPSIFCSKWLLAHACSNYCKL